MPVLETQRLVLREFQFEDLDALAAILCDRETMRYYPVSFDRAAVADWIQRNRTRYANDGYGLWAMILKSTRELIGDCGLVLQSVDAVDEIEIGYHVRRDLWNQGYASEAARACRDYGFANLKVDRLISLIRPENLASRRVAEKNGMTIWKEVTKVDLLHYVYAIKRDRP
ncbi:MAG: GNAT family N-acetyltransferase [Terriglobales bacterium]|jgi:ribosomal-protein-alanine N-acetyltransferase